MTNPIDLPSLGPWHSAIDHFDTYRVGEQRSHATLAAARAAAAGDRDRLTVIYGVTVVGHRILVPRSEWLPPRRGK